VTFPENPPPPKSEPSAPPTWSPSLREPAVLLLLALVLILELASWRATEGYQLADSVEFMERARSLERGQAMIDSVAIRPFGFSSLLVPFFALADWIGLPDQRAVAWAIVLLQMALGLGLVAVAMRIGGRVGGRRTGLLAGVITGANPVFLQYSSQPVSGLAAGICAGLALDAVLARDDLRSGLRCGLWLGAAFLLAFQSLLIAAALAVLLLLRDGARFRSLLPPVLRGMLGGLALAVLAQVLIDWASFGRPGASLGNYLAQNVGSVAVSFLARIGLRPLAIALHKLNLSLQGREPVVAQDAELAAIQSPWFYVVELPRMLAAPALAALLLGLARAFARPRGRLALPAAAFLLNVLAMSNKGSKDFRLWLPLLPWIAVICAHGWTWLRPARPGARAGLDLLFSGALVVLGCAALAPSGSRRFAAFWRAMDWADARAAATSPERRARVACAYHWAVFLRDSAAVDLVKLPWQLDLWPKYDAEQRADDRSALEGLDLFVAHQPLLTGNPEIAAILAPRFEVLAAFYDPRIDLARFGPVLVFGRRAGRSEENVLLDPRPGAGTPVAIRFSGPGAEGKPETLELRGWRYATLPPQGLGWLSLTWTSPTGTSRDHAILCRIECEGRTWQEQHLPGGCAHPAGFLRPGEVLTEGVLVVPAEDPYRVGSPLRPLGGDARGRATASASLSVSVDDLRPEAGGDGFARVATFELPLPSPPP
jgi:hypothetical protein